MSSEFHDVIVIGAGPAGATAANLLAQQGLDVLIVDRGVQPAPQLPQTCFGLRQELLSRLGIAEYLPRVIEAPKPVRFVAANWDFDFLIAVEPRRQESDYRGMRLNRSQFDQLLVESAVRHKATYVPVTTVEDFIFVGEQVSGVRCRTLKGNREYSGRAIVDTSGKFSLVASRLGLKTEGHKLDDRAAVFSHFTGSALSEFVTDGQMTVIALDGGYLLVAPLLGERVSVIAVLADAVAAAYKGDRELLFRETVMSWEPLAKAVASSQQVLPVLPVINHTWECKQFCGDGFLIAGEAAAFLDPFVSNGVAIAMDSGELVATALVECLQQQARWEGTQRCAAYDQQIYNLIHQRQQEAITWLNGLSVRKLVTTCADPHLPWLVPFALLNLVLGAGLKLDGVEDTSAAVAITAARRTYSTIS